MFDIEPEYWTTGEIAGTIIGLVIAIYGIATVVSYLKWRYGAPKLEAGYDDDEDDLGGC